MDAKVDKPGRGWTHSPVVHLLSFRLEHDLVADECLNVTFNLHQENTVQNNLRVGSQPLQCDTTSEVTTKRGQTVHQIGWVKPYILSKLHKADTIQGKWPRWQPRVLMPWNFQKLCDNRG